MQKAGALPIQELIELHATGFLQNVPKESFQPASIDLSVGEEMYRIEGSVLPRREETIRTILSDFKISKIDFNQVLAPGQIYLCKVAEGIKLPADIYGFTNPKSSTGRNDIHVRVLADKVPRFDSLPRGFQGEIWFLISSRNFPLKLTIGDKLAQLRLFNADTRLDQAELEVVYVKHQLLWRSDGQPLALHELKISDHDGSVILTIDLKYNDIIGYQAKQNTPVLEFSKRGHKVEDFFEPIERPKNGHIILQNGKFYILATLEKCRVPIDFAAEMAPMDERAGEFRSHYAGFIDPGWGHGKHGDVKGLPLVLEVRPFDDNLLIRHNQSICKLKYERLRSIPEQIYGETSSHYHDKQTRVLLSKHFFKVQ